MDKQELHSYLDKNWNIIPVYSVKGGNCACGRAGCPAAGKHPMLNDWKRFQNDRVTHEQLDEWIEQYPDSNYAVITGKISDLVVVDVDGEAGKKSFKEHIDEFPSTLISKTGKGYHLYYKYPMDQNRVRNAVGIYEGIDIRADGGYVLIPPSKHVSGNQYEWVNKNPVVTYKPIIIDRQEAGLTTEWADILSNGAEEGHRNDTLARLVGHYARLKIPYEELLVMMEEWNEKNKPPLPRDELLATIDSIYSREKVTLQSTKPMEVVDLQGLMTSTYNVGWLIKDIWIKENVGWIVGAAKTGKTWLGLDMGVSIASGEPFLGMFEVEQSGPVLMILEEDTAAQLQLRLGKVMGGKSLAGDIVEVEKDVYEMIPPKRIPLYFMIHQGFMFEEKKFEELEQKIKAIKPVMVIFDPFFRMSQGFDEYKATEAMSTVLNPLSRIRYQYNCAMAVVHHSSKHSVSSRGGERIYGSMAFHAWSESSMYLSIGKNGDTAIEREFKSAPSSKTLVVNFGNLDETYNPNVELTGNRVERINLLSSLNNDFPAGASSAELAEKTGQSLRTTQHRLKKMVDEGSVEKVGNIFKARNDYAEI